MRRLCLGILIVLFAGTAMATDLFTLNVPVQVSHLHPTVSQGRVRCTLSGRDPATDVMGPFGPATGKVVTFPVTAGAYSGNVTVTFTSTDFTPTQLGALSRVTQGYCEMQLFAAGSWYIPYSSATGAVVGHAAGTPFSSQVSFAIP